MCRGEKSKLIYQSTGNQISYQNTHPYNLWYNFITQNKYYLLTLSVTLSQAGWEIETLVRLIEEYQW